MDLRTIGFAILGILGAAFAKLIADEFKAWAPSLIEWVINRAVTISPVEHRERLAEEWRSHLNEIPGDISKLLTAFGCLVAGLRLPSDQSFIHPARIIDAISASIFLVLTAPNFLIIAIAVRCIDGGALFRRRDWVGLRGEVVHTLVFNTDDWGRLGSFLKKLNLHHLPRLFALLRGDISLIGPALLTAEQVAYMSLHIPEVSREYHRWKPGWIAPHSIKCDMKMYNLEYARGVIRYDLQYMQAKTLKTDLWLILGVFRRVTFG